MCAFALSTGRLPIADPSRDLWRHLVKGFCTASVSSAQEGGWGVMGMFGMWAGEASGLQCLFCIVSLIPINFMLVYTSSHLILYLSVLFGLCCYMHWIAWSYAIIAPNWMAVTGVMGVLGMRDVVYFLSQMQSCVRSVNALTAVCKRFHHHSALVSVPANPIVSEWPAS